MAEHKRILVSLPVSLLREMDRLAGSAPGSRSRLVLEALNLYLSTHRNRMIESLRAGYEEMAGINLALAEESFPLEHETQLLVAPRSTEAG